MGKQVGDGVATLLKRQSADRVSYDNTKRTPRKEAVNINKLAYVKPIPKA